MRTTDAVRLIVAELGVFADGVDDIFVWPPEIDEEIPPKLFTVVGDGCAPAGTDDGLLA